MRSALLAKLEAASRDQQTAEGVVGALQSKLYDKFTEPALEQMQKAEAEHQQAKRLKEREKEKEERQRAETKTKAKAKAKTKTKSQQTDCMDDDSADDSDDE